jgi:hypothetical protein
MRYWGVLAAARAGASGNVNTAGGGISANLA